MCVECDLPLTRRQAVGVLALLAAFVRSPRPLVGGMKGAVLVNDGLEIMPREAWADGREPTGLLAPESDVRFLLIHHTASANNDDPVRVMRSAYDFHTGPERGWPDVAYNFFIDQFGVVWEGRKGSLQGPVEASATGGSQGFAQLVCLLGDFTSQLPTVAALDSLNRTLAWLGVRHNISLVPGATTQFVSRGSNRWPQGTTVTTSTISGHRDMSRTACPGDTFYPYLVSNVPTAVAAFVTPSTTVAIPATQPPTTSEATTTSSSVALATPTLGRLPSDSIVHAKSTVLTKSLTVSNRALAGPLMVATGAVAAGVAFLLSRRRRSIGSLPQIGDIDGDTS